MLQIILAVIGISMVSVIGFVTIEMLAVQSIAQDQRENIRRLDIAAESLQGVLGRLPGVDTLLAPVGDNSGAYTRLPPGVGALNSNMRGVPFLYCPIANLNPDSLSAIVDPEVGSIQMPDSNYNISTHAGYVVTSSLGVNADVGALRPVAFILSAGRNADTPPSCNQVRMINGRAVVEGGLVRVVGLPAGVASTSNGIEAAAEFFVSDAGGGDGSTANSPTTIDAALRHFVRYSPSNMSIHVLGPVFPRTPAWSAFVARSQSSGANFRIVGENSAARIDVAASGSWIIPQTTVFENITIAGPQIIVGAGDELYAVGNVTIAPFNAPQSAVVVRSGGEFSARSSNVIINNANNDAITAEGSIFLNQSILASGNGQVGAFVNLLGGSELSLENSFLGTNAIRPLETGIRSSGAVSIFSDVNSGVFASTVSSECWTGLGTDIAFRWSQTGPGSRSSVRPEIEFPAPAADADPAIIAAFNTEFNERHRSRRINGSNLICS